MGAYEAGYLAGQVLLVVLLPVGIFVIIWLINRSKAPEAKRKAMRLGLLAAVATFVLAGGAVAVGGFLSGKGPSVEEIRAGLTRACMRSCQKRGQTEAECQRYCGCVGTRIIRDIGAERLARVRSPKDLSTDDRRKMVAAALACRK